MVNVSAKPFVKRTAVAQGKILLQRKTLALIAGDQIAKGNVFATARIAGIQAAKQTAQLIPLCHNLPLGQVNIEIDASKDGAAVRCTAQTIAQTGVEMEALVGATVALLTIYDMDIVRRQTLAQSSMRHLNLFVRAILRSSFPRPVGASQ